ncbi:MAG: oxidoreductase, partial [Chloroflexota bacterium]
AIVEAMALDLGNLESVKAFAAEANQSLEQIDLLVNNAGIMMTPYSKTTDGFESQFGVNHLGHFALTGLLLDKVNAAENGRIVNVSSSAHSAGNMDFDNLMFEDGNYSPLRSYGRSKLANLLFTLELDKRLKATGSDTISVSVHPGVNQTNLSRHAEERLLGKMMMTLMSFMMMDASQGALNTLRAAVDPASKGNEYYGPNGRGGFSGYPVVLDPSDDAKDADDAARLWQVSEELTGISFLS